MALPYQRRNKPDYSRGGGGGGLSRVFANLAGGAKTTDVNEKLPEDLAAILSQEGDTYVTKKGKVTGLPYSDARSGWAKMFGAPNTAEDLNLGLSEQQKSGEIKNKQELEQFKAMSPLKIREEIARGLKVPVEVIDTLSPTLRVSAEAAILANTQGSKRKAAEDLTATEIENETRVPKKRTSQQQSQRALTEEQQRAQAASSKEGEQGIRADYLARNLVAPEAIAKSRLRSVSPGEVQSFDPRNLPIELQKVLDGGFDAFGSTMEMRQGPPQKFGNLTIPGEPVRTQVPGSINPRTTMDKVNRFNGGTTPSAIPRATGEPFGPTAPFASPPALSLQTPQSQDTVYDFPPEIAAMLNDPRYANKEGVIKNYYNSLIEGAAPSMMDELSNFFGTSLDYKTKIRKQQELRRMLTPNY